LTKNLFCGLVWSRNLDKNPFIENKGYFSQGLPVEKKLIIAAIIISALLFSAVAGTQLANLGKANPNPFSPWYDFKEGRPEYWAKPPEISITSPKNNSIYIENSLNLTLSVSVDSIVGDVRCSYFIQEITYKADWLPKNKTVYTASKVDEFSSNINLKDIPEGKHSIVVFVIARGSYERQTGERMLLHPIITVYGFNVSSSSSVIFNIDTVPPEVSIMQMQNKTYADYSASLNFTVNEPVSQIWYVLDGHENVAISENVTLTGLMNGEHNVTVYAQDLVGHVGVSKSVIFTVAKPEPFPTTLIIAPIASVAVVGAGLLVYLKKHRR
jgi:hypothetical protein